MRISDWSSDVCSSDLSTSASSIACHECQQRRAAILNRLRGPQPDRPSRLERADTRPGSTQAFDQGIIALEHVCELRDRKSVGWGQRVSVRVDLGGRRIIKKKTRKSKQKRLYES